MLKSTIRSEAHFAALLYRELNNDCSEIRIEFLKQVSRLLGRSAGQIVSVFIEPAPFRDTWKKAQEDERARIIADLTDWFNQKHGQNLEPPAFKDVENKSLRSPASWTFIEMNNRHKYFKHLRFMFRARP